MFLSIIRSRAIRNVLLQINCKIHSNRVAVCRTRRKPNEYLRSFPIRIVFQDGSTINARHHVPCEIIKLPILFDECKNEQEQREWNDRRKKKEIITIIKDDTDINLDRSKYLKTIRSRNK